MSSEEKNYVVEFDDNTVYCKRPDGSQESVNWTDIVKVTIEATAGGNSEAPPHVWILWGQKNESGCVYPGGASGAEMMLVEMKSRLNKFDVGAVGEALKSQENKTWLLWEMPGTNVPQDGIPEHLN